MGAAEMEEIGRLMGKALKGAASDTTVAEVRRSVEILCERFPLYESLQAHATA
jgi:glycine/serine hydroxymethyltransferase